MHAAPSELVIPKINQDTVADMVGATRSCVSFFLKKFRKLGIMDYKRELHMHSSFLIIVLHEGALITNDRVAEAAPSCYRINSYCLSNLDQTAADLLPIMARKRGGLEMTGTNRYEQGDIAISHRRETS